MSNQHANPLVSILIPCYNAGRFVGEAIESALGQTHPHVEVIVIDDGSTDNSREVIASFGNRIQYDLGPNRGACAARNRALTLSRGKFIQFLDADDRLMPEKIERQLPMLLADEADLIFCKGYLLREDGNSKPKKRPIRSPVNIDPFVYCLSQGLATEGPLHKRHFLEMVGGFREHLIRGQETDLHIRLGATGARIHLVDEFLYEHRDHNGPRITSRVVPADYNLRLRLELKELLLNSSTYVMTDLRIQNLAGAIFQDSIYAFRNGARKTASAGFAAVRELKCDFDYSERRLYKLAARAVGPMLTEHVLAVARGLLRPKPLRGS